MLWFLSFAPTSNAKVDNFIKIDICDELTVNSNQSKLFQLFQTNALSCIFIVISSSLESILLRLKIVNAGSKSSSQYLVIIW